jgi:hypothetical protein
MPAKKKSTISDAEAAQIAMKINRSEFCRVIGQENVYRDFITDGSISENVTLIINAWKTLYTAEDPAADVPHDDVLALAAYFENTIADRGTATRGKVPSWPIPEGFVVTS